MSTAIPQRKIVELRGKAASLVEEFADWRQRSEQGGPLAKHHSQIRRVTAQLDAFCAGITEKLAGDAAAAVLAQCRRLEMLILELHRIWDFFRAKLAQRDVALFKKYLDAVDELAWKCYEPAQLHAAGALIPPAHVKEPPLVFFNGGSSPLVTVRGRAFEAEAVPGEPLREAEFARVLQLLPVPVIGVPWFQIRHLPDALVIAHEVGHCVDHDFGLDVQFNRVFPTRLADGGVPEGRRSAWASWRAEMFADVFAALALGPAYAGALIDFLATDAGAIARECYGDDAWGKYPTMYLRVLLVLEVMNQGGFGTESAARGDEWRRFYPAHQMTAFEADLPTVARILAEERFETLGNRSAKALFPGTVACHRTAKAVAEEALAEYPVNEGSIVSLFAAARLAFEEKPERYYAVKTERRLLGAISAGITSATRRSAERPAAVPGPVAPGSDAHAGAELLREVAGLLDRFDLANETPEQDGLPNREAL